MSKEVNKEFYKCNTFQITAAECGGYVVSARCRGSAFGNQMFEIAAFSDFDSAMDFIKFNMVVEVLQP